MKLRVAIALTVCVFVFVGCGGGGGGRSFSPTPPPNGQQPPPSVYPQHYTTDLDGTWLLHITNVETSDPYELLTDWQLPRDSIHEIQYGKEILGTLPSGFVLVENRVSCLSESLYELVKQGEVTQTIEGDTLTLTLDIIQLGRVYPSTKWKWIGEIKIAFWAKDSAGSMVILATLQADFTAVR